MNEKIYAVTAEPSDEERKRDMGASSSPSWLKLPFRIWVVSRQEYAEQKAWVWVVQLFNHHAHHRGQVPTLLSHLGRDVGTADFPKTPGLQQLRAAGWFLPPGHGRSVSHGLRCEGPTRPISPPTTPCSLSIPWVPAPSLFGLTRRTHWSAPTSGCALSPRRSPNR